MAKGESVFAVGQVYRNRLGDYEVVRINHDEETMLIRYLDSGDEQEVRIPIQSRIWRNMGIEAQEAIRQEARQAATHQRGYGADFRGLENSDFSVNVAGTSWRSRGGLAGRVAVLLSPKTPYTFISWSIYRWPVAFLTHLEDYQIAAFELGVRKAKFTIELDEQHLYYALYLERGLNPEEEFKDATWDWPYLMKSLDKSPELLQVIERAEAEHPIQFIGRTSSGDARFHYADGLEKGSELLWPEENPAGLSVAERMERLKQVPAGRWVEFYLLGKIAKKEAVKAGENVAYTIVEGMNALMPIYAAAISR